MSTPEGIDPALLKSLAQAVMIEHLEALRDRAEHEAAIQTRVAAGYAAMVEQFKAAQSTTAPAASQPKLTLVVK